MASTSSATFKSAAQRLIDASTELVFVPSPLQRKAKASYWSVVSSNPLLDTDRELTLAQIQQVVNDARLDKWWSEPGFKDWFANKDEFRQKLEYLCMLAQDTAEEILISEDPRSVNAKVSLIKVLLEAGGKVAPRQKEVKYLDEQINKMDIKQIEEVLKKAGRTLDGKKDTNRS